MIVGKDAQEKDIKETHPEGSCYLYHDQKWIGVGKDFGSTPSAQRSARYEEFRRLQGTARVHNSAVVPIAIRRTLADTVEDWRGEIQANKKHKSYLAYKKSTEYFLQSCTKPTVQSVDRRDMLNFKIALKGKGLSKRSVYNNFLNVMIFFKWANVEHGIQKGDWPPKPEREPEEHTDEEIIAILDAADDEEWLILTSFLCSGFRSGELANFTYADINFSTDI